MILLIDNYDSFTYNLAQQIEELECPVRVFASDTLSVRDIEKLRPQKIVISPGPKTPDSSGISLDVIKHFYRRLPILGVCLGHQCIGQLFGGRVVHSNEIVHGSTSSIWHSGTGLFEGLSSPFTAARYHSLAIDKVPAGFELTAWTKDQTIMAIQHQQFPLYGVQFHPESFMTEQGSKIMENFLHV